MQLHPAIDTDAGSIAAADGEASFPSAHVQRLVPAAEAAQSSHQACCSSNEASSRHSSLDQLHDEENGVHCGQMTQSPRQMGQLQRQVGQPERQSRSSSGPSHKQHGATSRSGTSILSNRTSKGLSDQRQHSAFRGVNATDHCSARNSAALISHSVGLSHGSNSARPDGRSPFASMQQTRHGQADSSFSSLKVCLAGSARNSSTFKTLQCHTCRSLPAFCQAVMCLCVCQCMQCEIRQRRAAVFCCCCCCCLVLG